LYYADKIIQVLPSQEEAPAGFSSSSSSSCSKSCTPFEEKDFKRIISMIQKEAFPISSVSPNDFPLPARSHHSHHQHHKKKEAVSSFLMILAAQSGDLDMMDSLTSSFGSLNFSSLSVKASSPSSSVALSITINDFFHFLKNVVLANNNLYYYLLFFKILFGIYTNSIQLVSGSSSSSSTADEVASAETRKEEGSETSSFAQLINDLSQGIMLSEDDISHLLNINKHKEHLLTFDAIPRINLLTGSPSKVNKYEVQGKASGFMTAYSISPFSSSPLAADSSLSSTPKFAYYEVYIKDGATSSSTRWKGVRIGWAHKNSIAASSENSSVLGDDENSWVFDFESCRFFHAAYTQKMKYENRVKSDNKSSSTTAFNEQLLRSLSAKSFDLDQDETSIGALFFEDTTTRTTDGNNAESKTPRTAVTGECPVLQPDSKQYSGEELLETQEREEKPSSLFPSVDLFDTSSITTAKDTLSLGLSRRIATSTEGKEAEGIGKEENHIANLIDWKSDSFPALLNKVTVISCILEIQSGSIYYYGDGNYLGKSPISVSFKPVINSINNSGTQETGENTQDGEELVESLQMNDAVDVRELTPVFAVGSNNKIEINVGTTVPFRHYKESLIDLLRRAHAFSPKSTSSFPTTMNDNAHTASLMTSLSSPADSASSMVAVLSSSAFFQHYFVSLNHRETSPLSTEPSVSDVSSSEPGCILVQNICNDPIKTLTFEISLNLMEEAIKQQETIFFACSPLLSGVIMKGIELEDLSMKIGMTKDLCLFMDIANCERVKTSSSYPQLLNEWHHLSFCYTFHRSNGKANILFLLDGHTIFTFEISSRKGHKPGKIHPRQVIIGAAMQNPSSVLKGEICNVRVWSTARSVEKIASSLGRSKLFGNESELLIYLPLEEGKGNLIKDYNINKASSRFSEILTVRGLFSWKSLKSSLTNVEESVQDRMSKQSNVSNVPKDLLSLITPPSTSDAIPSSSILVRSCFTAFFRKFISSVDKLLSSYQQKKLSLFQFQLTLPTSSALIQPDVSTFQVIKSILIQVIQCNEEVSLSTAEAERFVPTISLSTFTILSILKANIVAYLTSATSPSVSYVSPHTDAPAATKTISSDLKGKLFISLCYFISKGTERRDEVFNVDQALWNELALDILVRDGFSFFFDDVFCAVRLVLLLFDLERQQTEERKSEKSGQTVHSPLMSISLRRALSNTLSSTSVFCSCSMKCSDDIISAILAMSREGRATLLHGLCGKLGDYSVASQLLTVGLRPTAFDSRNPSISVIFTPLSTEKLGYYDATSNSSYSNLFSAYVGAVVKRGPDWQYGDEDGGNGGNSLGIVLKIETWNDQAGKGLLIGWKNGFIQKYRYGVVVSTNDITDGLTSKSVFDVEIISAPKTLDESIKDVKVGTSLSLENDKKTLLFSPYDVINALVHGEEHDNISKRSILSYMKDNANMEWQEEKDLLRSVNSLITKLNGSEISLLYRDFYGTFSVQQEKDNPLTFLNCLSPTLANNRNALIKELLSCSLSSVIHTSFTSSRDAISQMVGMLQYLLVTGSNVFDGAFGSLSPRGSLSSVNIQYHPREKPVLVLESFDYDHFNALLLAPCSSSGHSSYEWNWKLSVIHPSLVSVASRKSASSVSGDESNDSVKVISSFSFEKFQEGSNYNENITIRSRSRCIDLSLIGDRDWNTLISDSVAIIPLTGTYKWYVKLRFTERRSYFMVGLATDNFPFEGFLGSDNNSWGISQNCDYFHNGRKTSVHSGRSSSSSNSFPSSSTPTAEEIKLMSGMVLEFSYNSNTGRIILIDVSSTPPVLLIDEESCELDNINSRTVYPAFSLSTPGDIISLITDRNEITTWQKKSSAVACSVSSSPHQKSERFTPSVLSSVMNVVNLGSPNDLVISQVLNALSFLHCLISSESWIKVCFKTSLASTKGLWLSLHLFASLQRWSCPPLERVDEVKSACLSLLELLGKLFIKLFASSEEEIVMACKFIQLLASLLLLILSRCVEYSSQFSRLISMRDYDITKQESFSIVYNMFSANTTALITTKWDSCIQDVWMKSALFKSGITYSSATESLLAAYHNKESKITLFLRWSTSCDRTLASGKTITGAKVDSVVQLFFFCLLYHSGLLGIANLLMERLSQAIQKMEIEGSLEEYFVKHLKPPTFLTFAWKHSMKLKLWMKDYFATDRGPQFVTEEIAVKQLNSRILFLMKLSPCHSDLPTSFLNHLSSFSFHPSSPLHTNHDLLSLVSQCNSELKVPNGKGDLLLTSVSSVIRNFVILDHSKFVPLEYLQQYNKAYTIAAVSRTSGFQLFQKLLSLLNSSFSQYSTALKMIFIDSVATCVLKGHQFNWAFGPRYCLSSSSAVTHHYHSSLELADGASKQNLKGSFHLLFSSLISELDDSTIISVIDEHQGDATDRDGGYSLATATSSLYLLTILNALGIAIIEQDHVLLSRVKFFSVLKELLDATMAVHSFSSSIKTNNIINTESSENTSSVFGVDHVDHTDGMVTDSTVLLLISPSVTPILFSCYAFALSQVIDIGMKLFICMALQIAATDSNNINSIDALEDSDDIVPGLKTEGRRNSISHIPLQTVASGSATLSDAVFETLYKLIKDWGTRQSVFDSSDENFKDVLRFKQGQTISLEATSLLQCISTNSHCQKILASCKWVELLMELFIFGNINMVRIRSVFILSEILPLFDDPTLHLHSVSFSNCLKNTRTGELTGSLVFDDLSSSEKLVQLILLSIGTLFSSPHLRNRSDKDFSQLSNFGIINESIYLIRKLLGCRQWNSLVNRLLESNISSFVEEIKELHETKVTKLCLTSKRSLLLATLFVIKPKNGFSVFPYLGANSLVKNRTSTCFSDVSVGIVTSINVEEDKIGVLLVPLPSMNSSEGVTCVAVEECSEIVTVSSNKISVLERYPVNDSHLAVVALLPVLVRLFGLCNPSNEAKERESKILPSSSVQEEKKETVTAEEKSAEIGLSSLVAPDISESSFSKLIFLYILEVLRNWSLYLVSSLRTKKDSYCKNIDFQSLFDIAATATPSLGFCDILYYQEYLHVALFSLWKREMLPTTDNVDGGGNFKVASNMQSPAKDQICSPSPSSRSPLKRGLDQREDEALCHPPPPALLSTEEFDSTLVDSIAQIGFSSNVVRLALRFTQGDPNEALNYILANESKLVEIVASSPEGLNVGDSSIVLERERGTDKEEWVLTEGAQMLVDETRQKLEDSADKSQQELRFSTDVQHERNEVLEESVADSAERGEEHLDRDGSGTSSNFPVQIDDSSPVVYHCSGKSKKFIPFYAEPSFSSERLGCIYPADDIGVLEERIINDNVWYRLSFSDFDGNNYHLTFGDEIYDIFVWVSRYNEDGMEIILPGCYEGDGEGEEEGELIRSGSGGFLNTPVAEILHIDRYYRIIGANGALVREGVEITSLEISTLTTGEIVHASEESFNSEGTVRLRLDYPLNGWISKIFGLVERIQPETAAQSISDAHTGAVPVTSSSVRELLLLDRVSEDRKGDILSSDLDLLDQVEDNLEFLSGTDVFVKDDRFFGTRQGKSYSFFTNLSINPGGNFYSGSGGHKIEHQLSASRRNRVSGVTSVLGYFSSSFFSSVFPLSLSVIPPFGDKIDLLLDVLLTLETRLFLLQFLFSIFEQAKKVPKVDGRVEDQDSPFDDSFLWTSFKEKTATSLFRVLRMSVFRADARVRLRNSESFTSQISVQKPVALEETVGNIMHSILCSPAIPSKISQTFLSLLLSCIAKNCVKACDNKYADHCWSNDYFSEELDDGIFNQPNIQCAVWLTSILSSVSTSLTLPSSFISTAYQQLIRIWIRALRGSSMSLKYISLSMLTFLLHCIRQLPSDASSGRLEPRSTVINTAEWYRFLSRIIPIRRLSRFVSKRLWVELEDSPSFSRFIQAAVEFTSEVWLVLSCWKNYFKRQAILSSSASSLENIPLTPPMLQQQQQTDDSGKTNVLTFDKADSYLQLYPAKDINGSWTLEITLCRDKWIESQHTPQVAVIGSKESCVLSGSPTKGSGGHSTVSSTERANEKLGLTKLLKLLLGSSKPTLTEKKETDKVEDEENKQKSVVDADSPRLNQEEKTETDRKNGYYLPPVYIFTSSKYFIKLQKGGREFAADSINDPLQEQDPIHCEAYCLSYGSFSTGNGATAVENSGSEEKSFDFVVPYGEWLSITITCDVAKKCMTLFINRKLVECHPGVIPLPLSILGSSKKNHSFAGKIGELKVFSYAKSTLEVTASVTEMDQRENDGNSSFRALSQQQQYMVNLKFDSGLNFGIYDESGYLMACKPHSCHVLEFSKEDLMNVNSSFPVCFPSKKHAFREKLSSNLSASLFANLDCELTGIITVESSQLFPFGPSVFSNSSNFLNRGIKEIIILKFKRHSSASLLAASASSVDKILGLFCWSDRGIQCYFTGTINNTTNEVEFFIPSIQLFSGSPEKIEWLDALYVGGKIIDGKFEGNCQVIVKSEMAGLLAKDTGTLKLDKSGLCSEILIDDGTTVTLSSPKGSSSVHKQENITSSILERKASRSTTIEVKKTASEGGQYIAIYEVIPNPKLLSVLSCEKEKVQVEDISSVDSVSVVDLTRYGLLANNGSYWFDFLIRKNSSGNISFGFCTSSALIHPDASVDANDGTWDYSISGHGSHGADLRECEGAEENDIISVQFNTLSNEGKNNGIIRFWKNNMQLLAFSDVNSHAAVLSTSSNVLDEADKIKGVRPYVNLSNPSDSVVYIGKKEGITRLAFLPETESDRRKTIYVSILDGAMNGCGLMEKEITSDSSRSPSSEYWFGTWKNDIPRGTHILLPDIHFIFSTTDGFPGLDNHIENNIFFTRAFDYDEDEPVETTSLSPEWITNIRTNYGAFYKQHKLYRLLRKTTSSEIVEGAESASDEIPSPASDSSAYELISLTFTDQFNHADINMSLANGGVGSGSDVEGSLAGPDLSNISIYRVTKNKSFVDLFNAYSIKRDCPRYSLIFKFQGTVIDDNASPFSLGIKANDNIDVLIRSFHLPVVTELGEDPVETLFPQSEAPFILLIVYDGGATVRNGVEIEDAVALRTLKQGEILEGFRKASTNEGIGRYRIVDGWISERLRGLSDATVCLCVRERFDFESEETGVKSQVKRYRVKREDGAKIRGSSSLSSTDRGICPAGIILTVSEKRLVQSVDKDKAVSPYTIRLKISHPPEWAGGWISDKPHLIEELKAGESEDEDQIRINHNAEDKDLELEAELKRRRKIHLLRRTKLLLSSPSETVFSSPSSSPLSISVMLKGTISLSSETFFLPRKNRFNENHVLFSDDLMTITCPDSSSSSGRCLVLGSKGFSSGVHYWEVQVNNSSWGSVFIGVAPSNEDINGSGGYIGGWNGFGFINYRATQAFGSETLYGTYYGNNDKIGVLLDMNRGTLSFFKDGEDFNLGKVVVINMGIAYHNLRKTTARHSSSASSSSSVVVYPCFGMKNGGDQLTISNSHWISENGIEEASTQYLEKLVKYKQYIELWKEAFQVSSDPSSGSPSVVPSSQSLSIALPDDVTDSTISSTLLCDEAILNELYGEYCDKLLLNHCYIESRPGIMIKIAYHVEAYEHLLGKEFVKEYGICPGLVVNTVYGRGVLLGISTSVAAADCTSSSSDHLSSTVVNLSRLWYSCERNYKKAWYWTSNEFKEHLMTGLVTLAHTANVLETDFLPFIIPNSDNAEYDGSGLKLSQQDFINTIRSPSASQWTAVEDFSLTKIINKLSTELDQHPLYLSFHNILYYLKSHGLIERRQDNEDNTSVLSLSEELRNSPFREKSVQSIIIRVLILSYLNRCIMVCLPLIDLASSSSSFCLTKTKFDSLSTSPASLTNHMKELILSLKSCIFTVIKLQYWNDVMNDTTVPTQAPPDEYEKPDEIREVSINRIQSRNALQQNFEGVGGSSSSSSTLLLSWNDKFKFSVFGQLYSVLSSWDVRAYRRSYVHLQDAGQPRAFFVKFIGEGVDDQGGPYRAIFQTSIGEEIISLLSLLTGCPNAKDEIGENRDKSLFNDNLVVSASSFTSSAVSGYGRSSSSSSSSELDISKLFVHLGKLIGIACRHKILLPLPLVPLIWKILVEDVINSSDLQEIDTSFMNSLRQLLMFTEELPSEQLYDLLMQALLSCNSYQDLRILPRKAKQLVIRALNLKENADLSPLGSLSADPNDLTGTEENSDENGAGGFPTVHDLIELIQYYRLTSQNRLTQYFYEGLSLVLPVEILPIFTAEELEVMICGENVVDLEVLKKATIYESITPNDRSYFVSFLFFF
jgi:hypothetical protein